jgi:SsrA-binding protein
MPDKILASNRKANFEYFLLERLEAGISLHGSEIKSVRNGQMSLQEAYIQLDAHNAILINAHIATYNPASRNNHDPLRPRRLLLHKKQIREFYNAVRLKGVTVIPVKVYLKDGLAKVEIALARGKKNYDKRDSIAERDMDRENRRDAKNKYW